MRDSRRLTFLIMNIKPFPSAVLEEKLRPVKTLETKSCNSLPQLFHVKSPLQRDPNPRPSLRVFPQLFAFPIFPSFVFRGVSVCLCFRLGGSIYLKSKSKKLRRKDKNKQPFIFILVCFLSFFSFLLVGRFL